MEGEDGHFVGAWPWGHAMCGNGQSAWVVGAGHSRFESPIPLLPLQTTTATPDATLCISRPPRPPVFAELRRGLI